MRSKHLKSQCLLYWKYSKLLCIRTLVKLSYHTSSVEAVHSQVIFSFMIIFNFFLSFLLNFYFTFFICYCFGTEIFKSKTKSIKLLLLWNLWRGDLSWGTPWFEDFRGKGFAFVANWLQGLCRIWRYLNWIQALRSFEYMNVLSCVYNELQYLYRRFNTTIESSTEVHYFDLPHVC